MTISGLPANNSPRFDETGRTYDAVLVLSFGGPDGVADVVPFLDNVTRGRNVPPARLREVAEHYYHIGGASPINGQNRALIAALAAELEANGPHLPIYFGNRNWHPFVTDTIAEMRHDGVRRAIVFVTSAFSSYSGCRQYREDVLTALESLNAPELEFDKIRVFHTHPGFIEPMIEHVRAALSQIPSERRNAAAIIFSAHSIPTEMSRHCAYVQQLNESARLISGALESNPYHLAYQSRSGPPHIPWLEPDILETMNSVREQGITDVVVVPLGFISDHMEVLFDLDHEAKDHARDIGLNLVRSATVGTHPTFVSMIRELIVERMTEFPERRSLGSRGPTHDICPVGCCLLRTAVI